MSRAKASKKRLTVYLPARVVQRLKVNAAARVHTVSDEALALIQIGFDVRSAKHPNDEAQLMSDRDYKTQPTPATPPALKLEKQINNATNLIECKRLYYSELFDVCLTSETERLKILLDNKVKLINSIQAAKQQKNNDFRREL